MLTLKSPAKINWFLEVCGLREDGYHNIKSLIQKVTLYDILTFLPSDELILKTDLLIPSEQNLVYKATTLLMRQFRVDKGIEIHLKKNIPVSAGLGGGSSNAASVLWGLNKMWSLGLSVDELCLLAENLGADVPFFLRGPLALVEGRGERITDLKVSESIDILLVKPPIAVSTKWAYAAFDQDSKLTNAVNNVDNINHLIHAITERKIDKEANFFNDLESVIIKNFPVIGEIKALLLKEGAIFSLMSGSGSTVFGVFNSFKEAEQASIVFKDKSYWTTVVQTVTD